MSELPIVPAFVKVTTCGVDLNTASDCVHEAAHYCLIFSSFTVHKTNIHFLPPFVPNDYFWKKHADKGKERWQIYAWAIRDIISRRAKLEKIDRNCNDKYAYRAFVQKKKDTIECADGTVFGLLESDTIEKVTEEKKNK